MKRVGIPRALLYYRYGEFWRAFFERLGCEVVLSPPSDATVLEAGLDRVSAEVCLPIKLLAGHVAALEDRVEYIFLPRLVSTRKGLYACPKMIGIVDVVRLQLPPTVTLLAPVIGRGWFGPHVALWSALGQTPFRAIGAYRAARAYLASAGSVPDFPGDRLKIALLSHFYISGDGYVARDIFEVFKKADARCYLKEDLPGKILNRSSGPAGSIQWIFERELFNAYEFYRDRVDGICEVVSFGCGPDSLVSELMVRSAKKRNLPFLQLVIDEHTAKAGILTRLEAFVELVERRRALTGGELVERRRALTGGELVERRRAVTGGALVTRAKHREQNTGSRIQQKSDKAIEQLRDTAAKQGRE